MTSIKTDPNSHRFDFKPRNSATTADRVRPSREEETRYKTRFQESGMGVIAKEHRSRSRIGQGNNILPEVNSFRSNESQGKLAQIASYESFIPIKKQKS